MRAFTTTVVFSILAGISTTQSIDPDSVPLNIRQIWCTNQITSCPLLCLQYPGESATTAANDCDPETLTYNCVCENGLSPNASEFSQTIPFYICQEFDNQCAANCGANNICADECRSQHPCGAQNPTRVNTSTITTMSATPTDTPGASSTGMNSAQYTGFGGAAPTSASNNNNNNDNNPNKNAAGALALEMGQTYGLGVVMASLFASFALFL